MIPRFLGAVQFLTVIPAGRSTASPGSSALFFPLVGALVGALGGWCALLAMHVWNTSIAALLTLVFLIALTGALHEDGLADVCDAFRAGRSREKILLILKDSRIGTYGAVGLILTVLLRWQALANSKQNPVSGLAAALALSRMSMVGLAAIAPPTGAGLAVQFAQELSRKAVAVALIQAILFAFVCGWRHGVVMILVSTLITLCARSYFLRHLGGVNGDCLGATCQAVETANLLILAWQPCF